MNKPEETQLDRLIHDMNSKCASLKTAVAMLGKASSHDRKDLLALMKRQAASIADDISAFEATQAAK